MFAAAAVAIAFSTARWHVAHPSTRHCRLRNA